MATVETLVVAGGGGGGGAVISSGLGGGAGAGGFKEDLAFTVTPQAYTITVGTGGAGGAAGANNGVIGNDSIFSTITMTGGGRGATNANAGGNGGSGGGGSVTTQAGGTGTAGQGNNGGTGGAASTAAGGGGGASAVGANTVGNQAGNGGAGTASSLSGASVTYGGGGGGGGAQAPGNNGTGGTGGGGNGGYRAAGVAGTTNTGGGGGGASADGASGYAGGTGGSGIVIIRYLTDGSTGVSSASTGGTKTTSGSYTIHTFTTSGTFTMVAHSVQRDTSLTVLVSGGVTTQTRAMTLTGSNRFLVVHGLSNNGSFPITGITYAGVSLTKAGSTRRTAEGFDTDTYYLINPASGTNDIVTTTSGSTAIVTVAISYIGVNQSFTPVVTTTTGTGTSLSNTLTTTAANSWIFAGSRTGGNEVAASGTNYTRVASNASNGLHAGDTNAAIATPASTTVATTIGSQDWGWLLMEIQPTSSAAAVNSGFLMLM